MLLAADVSILGDAGITIAIGLVVVFLVLLLLTGVFKLFGVIMAASEKKAPVLLPDTPASAVAPAAPVAPPAPDMGGMY